MKNRNKIKLFRNYLKIKQLLNGINPIVILVLIILSNFEIYLSNGFYGVLKFNLILVLVYYIIKRFEVIESKS